MAGVASPGAALRSAAFRGHVAILQRLRRWAAEEEIVAAALAAAAAGQAMGGCGFDLLRDVEVS